MAHDYTQGLTYVLVKHGSSISLAKIILTTGELYDMVPLDEKFAGITFSTNGVLYGITGDGADTPETLYEIDPGTGAITFIVAPGEGSDGEAIAFNTSDGYLYRYGGGSLLQKIDPTAPLVIDIPFPHVVDNYAHAMALDFTTIGRFHFTAGDTIYQLTTTGQLTAIAWDQAVPGNGWKGLVPESVASVPDGETLLTFEAYPNPVVGTLILGAIPAGNWTHTLIDAAGREMRSLSSTLDQVSIDVVGLSPGTYCVQSRNRQRLVITPVVVQ